MTPLTRRPRFSYANVASTLAVFLAVGGGTAMALQGQNTVKADDIAPNAVRSSDIRNGTVQGADLAAGSVGTTQIAAGAVGSGQIAGGAVESSQLAPGSIKPEHLAPGAVGPINEAVPYGGDGKPNALLPLSQKQGTEFTTIDTIKWTEASGGAGPGRTYQMHGAVEVHNDKDSGPATEVEVRVVMDGKAMSGFSQTVSDATTGTVPVSIRCDGYGGNGEHEAQLQIRSLQANVTITDSSFSMTSFGPIFNPPAS